MIATGRPYREALKDYAKSDLNYKWEPTSDEWKMYELIEPMLFAFAQVTTAFSAQAYPTANIFYRHIVSIKIALRKAIAHRNPTYKAMGEAMMEKFNKYWEEKNNVMVLATILDPRYKMFYIDWAFKELYDEDTAIDEISDVHVELEELFDKFDTAKKMAEKSTTPSSNICITSSSMPASDSAFQTHRRNTTTKSSKSELRNYLEDALEDPNPKFILLDWWKVNSLRYPVLSKMARRFLTIPASSVSSESTFSTGGRVLDDYRSSLKPAMVEALVCGASYIKGSHSDLNVMEKEEDDEENVETVKLPKSATNINY
ncbi:zinc finger BED domain-containing protein RICESLEEPER 2-like [Lolium perenne]|uniref:zinc finger BED domain-containing protein RICESLEEPER 2-like n=1 Tax=Lolium perenne TaxID=4522 RepID=UPI003A993A34